MELTKDLEEKKDFFTDEIYKLFLAVKDNILRINLLLMPCDQRLADRMNFFEDTEPDLVRLLENIDIDYKKLQSLIK